MKLNQVVTETTVRCFHDIFKLPLLTPQANIFGITDEFTLVKNKLLKNHILLIFKLRT